MERFPRPLREIQWNKPASTGTDDLSFLAKLAINDINEVVKGFLIAAEEKEKDIVLKKSDQNHKLQPTRSAKSRS